MKRKPSIPWEDTEVSTEKSLSQIRALLSRYGCDKWSFPEEAAGDISIFFSYKGQPVNIDLHARKMYRRLVELHPRSERDRLLEQARRITARQAYHYLKVTFEVIETGLFSPVEALLAHMVTPDGRRISDFIMELQPNLSRLLSSPEDK